MNTQFLGRLGCRAGVMTMIAAFVTCITLFAPAARAQSEAELKRENQALKEQVKSLQDQLKATQDQLRQLQAEVARLRGSAAPEGDAGASLAVTIDETVPSASPRALLNAMKAGYADAMKDSDMGQGPGDKARVAYLRDVAAWVQRANRDMRSPITWHVRVQDHGQRNGRYVTRLLAVDPQTGAAVGEAFDVALSRAIGARLDAMAERGELQAMELKGVLMPAAVLNEERTRPGVFDNPPLIGAFAEFFFEVDVQSLTKPVAATNSDAPGGSSQSPAAPETPKRAAPVKP